MQTLDGGFTKSLLYGMALGMALTLSACGGGGDDSPPPPPPPPPAPSALSYPAQSAYTVGTAITVVNPTVSGSPTSYTVAPALPAGLTLSATAGTLTGTPTAVAAQANYVVTASNTSGSTTATLALTVNDRAPNVDYPAASYRFATQAAASVTPSSSGGAVVSWSIDHALPAGLGFSTSTGVISGTPTQIGLSSDYVVTATNTGGTDTFTLRIAVVSSVVQNGVLIDLGAVENARTLVQDGNRIAIVDGHAHAVLWDAQTGAILARQQSAFCIAECGPGVQLAGNSMVTRNDQGFVVRSPADGSTVATVSAPLIITGWWTLASDGSYFVSGDAEGLKAWSRSGTALFTRAGNYRFAMAFAAPGELRIGAGPAGAAVIEKIAVPSGASTSSAAFNGTFKAWYANGDRFLTAAGNTILVYSKDIAQLDIAATPLVGILGGSGNYFWSRPDNDSGTLYLYKFGTAGADSTSYPVTNNKVIPAGSTLAILSTDSIGVIDLSGATPSRTDYNSPISDLRNYAANSSSDWVVGNYRGVTLGELGGPSSPQIYARGTALSVAGGTSFSAVAVADGKIDFFEANTGDPLGSIDMLADKIAMSTDGAVLAATDYPAGGADRSLRFYSLPSGNLISQMQFSASTNLFRDFELSGSGTAVALYTDSGREVRTLQGAQLWSGAIANPTPLDSDSGMRLSPSAGLLAVASGTRRLETGTNLYTSYVLSSAVTGWPVGWIDDTRLLVNRYRYSNLGTPQFDGVNIVSNTGALVASPALVEMGELQPVSANSIYSPFHNQVLDLTTGNTLWSSTSVSTKVGAVAGTNIVFATSDAATVRIEPR